MTARTFDFMFDGRKSWAMAHTVGRVTLGLDAIGAAHSTIVRLTPAEARAMACALEAAATWAENVLETGLGESAVDAPAVAKAEAPPAPVEPFFDIVFDGPPAHESGRFVEVEDETGKSISIGEWVKRDNDLWALRIPRTALTKSGD